MGNSIRRVGLLSGAGVGSDQPFHVQLGKHVSIDLSKRKVHSEDNGGWSEKWTMSYFVDHSMCSLNLTRLVDEDGSAQGLVIELCSILSERNGKTAEFYFRLDVETVTESDDLVDPRLMCNNGGNSTLSIKQSKQTHAGNGVTETKFFLYGVGEKGGLIVLEEKKKNVDEPPYAVTMAHYLATTSGINDFAKTNIDIGLSAMAKIRASNGNLDISVEGPDQHPAFALRYLFDEVMRTGIWKPTICPHCANIKNQRSLMFWQSDSEDSDSVSKPPRRGEKGITNGGKFLGNGNGNFIDKNVMVFRKRG